MKTHLSRKSSIGVFALVATLATPLAFAQSQSDPADTAPQPTTSSDATTSNEATTSNDAAGTAEYPAAANSTRKSWADVDTDQDGKLSKSEASAVPALAQMFDQADADADGALTTDEYKAHVAQSHEVGAKDADQ